MFPPPDLLSRGPDSARQFLAQAGEAGIDHVCCGDHVSFYGLGLKGDLATGLDVALLTAIWRLPRRQREVIALRIFLDLDTDTIARQMRVEAGTVRMHLSRGVAALRHELTPDKTAEASQ